MIRFSDPRALAIGVVVGSGIGFVDSRPGWDDTGVTAAVVFLSSALLSALRPGAGILAGLSVGLPVLAFNVVMGHGYGALFAVGVALMGAAFGRVAKRSMSATQGDMS